ncbi:MAG: preprotein translocase subunit SecE [Phycisphaerales bacterium]|nr:preprotein translocase subunit SecE [Phycisphaerales bacterium]
MALGIYKQGQGYWIRVMTALFVGVLVLTAAAWGWKQAGAVRLPARSWTVSLSDTQIPGVADITQSSGSVNADDTVILMGYVGTGDELEEIGRGLVESFTPDRGNRSVLVVYGFDSDETRDTAGDAERIIVGNMDQPTMSGSVRSASSTPIFPVQYLQTGVASGLLLVGAIALYWFIGSSRKSVEFLIATDGEMKKVNWTSYREVKGSTIVVIVATFLIAGLLYVVDIGFSYFFSAIGVLER